MDQLHTRTPSAGNSRRSSANSTPKLTPSVSALHSTLGSPTAPLSRAASPKPFHLPRQRFVSTVTEDDLRTLQPDAAAIEQPDVEDDAFAPAADPGLLSATPEIAPTPQLQADVEHEALLAHDARRLSVDNAQLSSIVGEAIVISGGTGYNDLIGATPGPTTYVMPISDNGGSSSEIIRTLSGPSIGDIRSRLVRLIPLSTTSGARTNAAQKPPKSNDALHALLSYRLPTDGRTRDIKSEWLDLLEGRHRLWRGIEPDRKEVIRGFLVHFQSEILRRAHRNFNLRGLSVGNAFLSAAQKFFRSIQSAIFLFSATTLVAGSGAAVLPCINTNHTATIAAELEDGTTLVGQCEISHPARPVRKAAATTAQDWSRTRRPAHLELPSTGMNTLSEPSVVGTPSSIIFDPLSTTGADLNAALDRSSILDQSRRRQEDEAQSGRRTVGNSEDGLSPEEDNGEEEEEDDDDDNDAHTRGPSAHDDDSDDDLGGNAKGLPRKRKAAGNIVFTKGGADGEEPLPSPIRNIYYINSYRNIVWPAPNPSYVSSLHTSRTLIYSCGSLWTSIIPSLALRGIGTSIARSSSLKYKVLLLNTTWDRETDGYTATHFIDAITRTLNISDDPPPSEQKGHGYQSKDFITHVVYYVDSQVRLDRRYVEEQLGITCVEIESQRRKDGKPSRFSEHDVRWALAQIGGEV